LYKSTNYCLQSTRDIFSLTTIYTILAKHIRVKMENVIVAKVDEERVNPYVGVNRSAILLDTVTARSLARTNLLKSVFYL
jgi:hypothetical protein